MSRFFINNPIVAMVIAIVTIIAGAVSILTLPTAQFPNIADPQIQVLATYPGADAVTVGQSVATPIEQQMAGVAGMNYMYSLNANNGQSTLTIDFDINTNANTDQILAQMRQGQAASQLPAAVNSYGVTVQQSTAAPMMLFDLYSPTGQYSAEFLANYATINLNNALTRVPGIASVTVFGSGQYAMRLWVKPDQLAKLQITVPDIINAVQAQNTVNPAGQIGGEPVPAGQDFTYAVLAPGRLVTEEQFGEIALRVKSDGSVVRVKDVARVELGSQVYNLRGRLDGKPSAVVAIYQLPNSNLVKAAQGAAALMAEAKKSFPPGLDYTVALDTSIPVTTGIQEILKTLVEALVLVIIVVYIFLQGWRATLIPLMAVPVSLVGTFLVFPMLGFSVNTLSLFGMVLAIGLVVDDAIVVVEAVEHHIEEGLSPKDAAFKAMEEVSAPVMGIAMVLSAVFIPTAFIPGITGRLYQQFAVTIAVSVILSAFNALSLSPALSALLLRPRKEARGPLGAFFNGFNRLFGWATRSYVSTCGVLIHKWGFSLLLLAGFACFAGWLGTTVPGGFLPDEDQGYVFGAIQLPDASSLQRADKAAGIVDEIIRKTPGVAHCTTVVGYNMLSGVQNTYSAFFWITFKDWKERTAADQQYEAIKAHMSAALKQVPEGVAIVFAPPAIPGVGAGGLQFVLEDRSGSGMPFLTANLEKYMAAARKRPELGQLLTVALPSVPQVFLNVDRDKVLQEGVALKDVTTTLQAFMGGAFINYFNVFGRQWQVYAQAEGTYRTNAENFGLFYVRNNSGNMVPLSTLASVEQRTGPEFVMHYNSFNAAQIIAGASPGYTSEQAMGALESVFAETMPSAMGFDYMGMAYQQQQTQKGVPPTAVFGLSLLFVFLVLSALYRSWTLPFSVLLSTPIAVFGALGTLYLRRLGDDSFETDVYAQIGLVMLIGLAAKNAILIVEFAKAAYDEGTPLVEAALAGAKTRLRPILMTSFAFILGCVPLWRATGSGALSRRIMGATVIGGMLASSALAIFIIPVLFYIFERLAGPLPAKPVALEPGAVRAAE
jgi:HAE1 family hydrophobic/amphiphilic exporter-1